MPSQSLPSPAFTPGRVTATLIALGVICWVARTAEPEYTVKQPEPGGLAPHPLITQMQAGGDGKATVQWKGFGGKYQVEQAPHLGGAWAPAGETTDPQLQVPTDGPMGFFRVNASEPNYAGATTCKGCHRASHDAWAASRHGSNAFDTLKRIGQHTNPQCLACHTVGYGYPTGFKDEASTPGLKDVQCENCHGPAGDHARDPRNAAKRPLVDSSAMICGGCHNGFHHPTYDEWTEAGHSVVTPAAANYFLNPDPATAASRMNSCGPCHSGAVRQALLWNAENPTKTPKALPPGSKAATTPVVCSSCHDPHASTTNPAQLRNPTKSLVPFSYVTSIAFTNQYRADVQMCGQCHNARGAAWTDTARYPHYSPQYNILIGSGGVEVGTPKQSSHRDNLNQCAGCHTHPHGPADPTENDPAYTGHKFEASLAGCTECHTDEATAAALTEATQQEIRARIDQVKTVLDTWATTKAAPELAKYGKLAWEYTTVGHISNPNEVPGVSGPNADEQKNFVPEAIKKARFNLYLIYQDHSFGVHNAEYARYLLQVAEDLIQGL